MSPGQKLPLLLLLLWVFPLATAGAASAAPELVARWSGGELTRELFLTRYDAEGRALAQGGRVLDEALCKAVFQEIYTRQAEALGLDRSAELARELASWREGALATAWRRQHQPDFAAVATPQVLETFYAERASSQYAAPVRADLDVLFLRCNLRPHERAACRERAAALDARLASGEEFSALVAEEKPRSGDANATIFDTYLSSLSDELAAAAQAAPVGGLSPWVELPHGLVRLRVRARGKPEQLPLSSVEPLLRRDWLREKTETWLREEATRLGAARDAEPQPVLAAAARAAGLDREPGFVAKEDAFRRWWLADEAFYRDEQLWPSAEQVSAARAEASGRLARVELLVAKIGVGDDRSAALRTAGELADRLATAESPLELLRAAASKTVTLETLGPLTLAELRPVPLLREAVETLETGGWRGPLPLPVEQLAPALAATTVRPARDYEVLAFVVVVARQEPSDADLRRELMRQLRVQISTGTDAFLAKLGARWQIELLPPPADP